MNQIFTGIVTKIDNFSDTYGNIYNKIFAKVYSETDADGIGADFEVKLSSIFPTSPMGAKGHALPSKGQRVLLYRTPYGLYDYIIAYLDYYPAYTSTADKTLEEGEFRISLPGIRPTEFSVKQNNILFDAGGYTKLELSDKAGILNYSAPSMSKIFHGGYEDNIYIKPTNSATTSVFDNITSSIGVWTKYKESNSNSDKYQIETEQIKSISTGSIVDRYVDKVVERKGAILDYNNSGNPLKHVYQLETRQSVGAEGVKDTFSSLKLGYQEGNYGNLPDNTGFIIDWSTKRVHSTELATTSVWKRGLSSEGELQRSQVAYNFIVNGNIGSDPAAKDQGYDYLDITSQNESLISGFWHAESINTGQNSYFYRKGFASIGFLHNYEESTEENFINLVSSRKDGIINEFYTKLSQENYKVNLETEKNIYNLEFLENTIQISVNSKDNNKKYSTITLDNDKLQLKHGDNAIFTLSEGTLDVDVKDSIKINVLDGGATITAKGDINVSSTTSINVTSPDTKLTGQSVKVSGNVTPTGSGAFCGIKYCLFSGAPHVGSTSLGN